MRSLTSKILAVHHKDGTVHMVRRRFGAVALLMALAVSATSTAAFADGNGPPALTNGNNWYDGQAAANFAIDQVHAVQPFDEACAYFVSEALWNGGLPEDDTWNENTMHGGFWNSGAGSPTAADVPLLAQYLLNKYPASYLIGPISHDQNNVPEAQVGDVVIYVWNGDAQWLTDGDTRTHMALITNMDGQYPDVEEWGDSGGDTISPDAQTTFGRGWTWSQMNNEWLANEPDNGNWIGYVLHIDTSTPATY